MLYSQCKWLLYIIYMKKVSFEPFLLQASLELYQKYGIKYRERFMVRIQRLPSTCYMFLTSLREKTLFLYVKNNNTENKTKTTTKTSRERGCVQQFGFFFCFSSRGPQSLLLIQLFPPLLPIPLYLLSDQLTVFVRDAINLHVLPDLR